MAGKTFSKEELNFFKFSSIVLDEFPKMLRSSFIRLWDRKISTLPGYQAWDDSVHVRNLLLTSEGGKTDIPTSKSINEWDCTALFKATIFSNTFALGTAKAKKTLHDLYLKGKKPSPFHSSVISSSGNMDETLALSIDQLRLLRNTLCHMSSPCIEMVDFNQYLQLAKDSFTANGVSVECIEDIGCLGEEDFPTEKVNDLNERIKIELQECNKFFQEHNKFLQREVADQISEINGRLRDVQDLIKNGNPPRIPESCVPPLTSDFVGRDEECNAVIESMMSQSKRLFSIWGSPGFGKTSTAIKIANRLKSQEQSVYYFSFRAVSSMKGFISKVLGLFGRATDSSQDANLTAEDVLLRAFECIKVQVFVILDNLDDLLSTSDQKQVMLDFITCLLHRCPNVFLLATTRESLEFISRMKEFGSLRLQPLDTVSSQILIRNILHSGATADIQNRVSKLCGNIPLAIKLLCSLIKDNPREFLEEISRGSECILDVLDDPFSSTDARLKGLIQVSFSKLSIVEKEAFISLSVFEGAEFGLDAGIAIVGGVKIKAKRHIQILERKSLIDVNDGCQLYAIHPLIQSFARQKAEKEMTNVLALTKARFNEYYISLFESLNSSFLNGESMSALKTFYLEERHILASLTNGLSDDLLLKKVIGVLQRCEFFLDSLYPSSLVEIELLYESALSRATDATDIAGLRVSKQFFWTTFVSQGTWEEGDETSAQITQMPLPLEGKFLCYKGIYELSNGCGNSAAQRIEKGLSLLSNNPEHDILKILALQLLALYHKSAGNFIKHKQFLQDSVQTSAEKSKFQLLPPFVKSWNNEKPGSRNQPLKVWAIARFSLWTRNFPGTEFDSVLKDNLDLLLKETSNLSISVGTVEASTLLQLCDMAYVHLCASNLNEKSNFAITVDVFEKDLESPESKRFENPREVTDHERHRLCVLGRLAAFYHSIAVQRFGNGESVMGFILKELQVRRQLPVDAKLAECYRYVGNEQYVRHEYESALESYKCALKILVALNEEIHAEVAALHYVIGVVQDYMQDSESSLKSYLSALKISVRLYGGLHPYTVMIQERINRHPFSLRYDLLRGKRDCRRMELNYLTCPERHSDVELPRIPMKNQHYSGTVHCCFFN